MSAINIDPAFTAALVTGLLEIKEQAAAFSLEAYERCASMDRNKRQAQGHLEAHNRDTLIAKSISSALGLNALLGDAASRARVSLPVLDGVPHNADFAAGRYVEDAVYGLMLALVGNQDPHVVARLRNPWAIAVTGAPAS